MAIGPTLQDARLKKQLTTSQVAGQTRMKVQIVDDLEHDDFHRIAATIYGKGFIKLFAECVDLDPAPLIADYMRTVRGEHDDAPPGTIEPDTKPEAETAATPDSEEPPAAADLFEFASSRRRRIMPSGARPGGESAAPHAASRADQQSPAGPATDKPSKGARTRSVRRPLVSTLRDMMRPLHDRSQILLETIKNRLADFKWNDRVLRMVGMVVAGLVLLLVLIAAVRFVATRLGPRPLADDELILFVPPPEPYVE